VVEVVPVEQFVEVGPVDVLEVVPSWVFVVVPLVAGV
jgi:hypothetical protein